MSHPQVCDHVRVSWWPVSRVTGHHGLTGETWQRLRLNTGLRMEIWAQPRPGQAHPAQRPDSAQSQWPGSAGLQCEPEPPHGISSCILLTEIRTHTGLSLVRLNLPRPLIGWWGPRPAPWSPLSMFPVSPGCRPCVCHADTCVTPVTGTRGWLWRFVTVTSLSGAWRHNPAASVTTTLTPDGDHYKLSRLRGSVIISRGHQASGQYKQHTFPSDQTYYLRSTIPFPFDVVTSTTTKWS